MGFADGHPVGTYQVLNPKTYKICLTKYMTFLNKSYDQWGKVKNPVLVPASYEGLMRERLKWFPNNIILIIIIM